MQKKTLTCIAKLRRPHVCKAVVYARHRMTSNSTATLFAQHQIMVHRTCDLFIFQDAKVMPISASTIDILCQICGIPVSWNLELNGLHWMTVGMFLQLVMTNAVVVEVGNTKREVIKRISRRQSVFDAMSLGTLVLTVRRIKIRVEKEKEVQAARVKLRKVRTGTKEKVRKGSLERVSERKEKLNEMTEADYDTWWWYESDWTSVDHISQGCEDSWQWDSWNGWNQSWEYTEMMEPSNHATNQFHHASPECGVQTNPWASSKQQIS